MPFQTSAKSLPIATHADADVHETAFKVALLALAGVVVGWTDQFVPSHASTPAPTATQSVGEGHETPFSAPDVLPTSCIVQFVPSHRSARPVCVPDLAV